MIQAWRIVHQDYLASAFDGEGARLVGGRWNSEGTPVVYTAGSLSLALLEIIVHLEIKEALKCFKALPVLFDESLIQTLAIGTLPQLWGSTPPLFSSKMIGDKWVRENNSAVLCVPSVIVPQEKNYLLNPQHPDFPLISIGDPIDLPLDPRVFAKLK